VQFHSPKAAVRREFPYAKERRMPKARRQTFAVRDATCPHNVRHALKVSAALRSAHHARACDVQREATPMGRAAAAWVARMRRGAHFPLGPMRKEKPALSSAGSTCGESRRLPVGGPFLRMIRGGRDCRS
jgi:hypothetical protein